MPETRTAAELGIDFDPEGEGYDYDTAIESGDRPDESGHWSSLDPRNGLVLKGRRHESFPQTIEEENRRGNILVKKEDGRYYSVPQKSVRTAADLLGPEIIDSGKLSAEEIPDGDRIFQKTPVYKKMYENILTGQQDWDSFIPDEKRVLLRETLPDFEDGAKRLINSAYLADLTGIDIESAYLTHDQLTQTLLKERTPSRAFDRIKKRFNNGRVQVQIMDIGYQSLTGKMDPAVALDQIQKLRAQLTSDYREDLRGFGEHIMGATAEQLPNMWEAIKASPWGAGGGAIVGALVAAVAGQLGPQMATPEEATTLPAGMWFGAKVGGGVAAANRIRELEAGGMYLELLEMKNANGNSLDPAIAAVAAHAVGVINGGLELVEWAALLETFGIGTKVFERASSKATESLLAKGTIKQIAAKYSMKYAASLTVEVLQELSQESTNIVMGELAKHINNELKGTDIQPITKEELLDRYYQTTTESIKGFALLIAPGTIFSAGKEIVSRETPSAKLTQPVIPKEGTVQERVYMKGFTARLTSIRNNADNLIAGAGKKSEQIKKIKEEYALVQKHYQSIADIIEQNKEALPQLAEIQKLLPDYEKAIDEFTKKPTQEGFERIKAVGDKIADLGMAYGQQISTEKAKQITQGSPAAPATIESQGAAKAVYEAPDIDTVETKEEVELTPQETADLAQLEVLPETQYRPSKRKPSPQIREFLTPGSTVEAVVKEYTALFKKAAQAARTAFVSGKKEGIVLAKEHYAELKAREKTRKELKKRVAGAVQIIKKDPPKSIDYFFRRLIEEIQDRIDPSFRTEKTRQRRQQMRDFLEQATPEQKKEFPEKLAALLDKKTLNELTVEELERIAAEIKRLTHLGKTKWKARKAIEQSRIEKTVTALTRDAGSIPVAPESPRGIDYSRTGLVAAIRGAYLWTLRIPRLLDWLDGRKGTFRGVWHETFYNTVNRQTDAELRMSETRHRAGMEKMAELNITLNELADVDDFTSLQEGLYLSKEQQMGLYAALKNPLATDAMVNGNRIALKTARAIVSNLDPKYKDMTDFIVEEYQAHYGRIREVYVKLTNEDLGKEEFYTPIVRLEQNEQVSKQEIIDQLLERHGLKKGYVEKKFTIDRKNLAPEHQKPMDLRLISVWQSQVQKQEHFIHFSDLIQTQRKVLAHAAVRTVVEQTVGKQGIKMLEEYVSRVANPNIYRAYDGLAGVSRFLRRNVAMSYLAYNLMTIAKQVPSAILYLKDAGPSAMFSSLWEFSQNPRAIWNLVREKDPQVKNAFIEREMEELRRQLPYIKDKDVLGKINKIIAVVGDKGMIGIRYADGIARRIGWYAVYQKNRQLGLSDAEAALEAQNSTLRTQPAAAPKDLAQLYATNEFLNWFTMFTNQLNNIWNITTYDLFAYWSNKKYQEAAMTLFAVGMNALFLWMLVNKKLPEDEDDLMDAALDQSLNMLPLINSGAMVGKRGWGTLTPPPLQTVTDIAQIYAAKDKEKQAIKALKSTLVLTGIPVQAIQRSYRFAETGQPGQLLGGQKPLVSIEF